jgi:hypothetical protein
MQMTTFTTDVHVDDVRLMYKVALSTSTFAERLALITDPFSTGVWLLILAVIVTTGISYSAIRGGFEVYNGKRGDDLKTRAWGIVKSLGAMLFGALLEVATLEFNVARDGNDNPLTGGPDSSANVIKLALALFTLLTFFIYSAKLTANIVEDDSTQIGLSSMEECIAQTCTVCVAAAMKDSAFRIHGGSIQYYEVPMAGEDVAKALREGHCDIALLIERVYATEWDSYFGTRSREDMCQYAFSEVVMPLTVGQPVREEYADALSYWANSVAEANGYLHKLMTDYAPLPGCGVIATEEDTSAITVNVMVGPAVVFFGLIVALFLYKIIRRQIKLRAAMKTAGSTLTKSITEKLTDDDTGGDESVDRTPAKRRHSSTNANDPFLVMAASPAPAQQPSPASQNHNSPFDELGAAARDASASASPSGIDLELGEKAGGKAGERAATGEAKDGAESGSESE